MSTGLNCEIVEPTKGIWYYVLEHGFAPKDAWAWKEYASAYGPFPSERAAIDHLHDNHANPGGYVVVYHDEFSPSVVYERLFREATC